MKRIQGYASMLILRKDMRGRDIRTQDDDELGELGEESEGI